VLHSEPRAITEDLDEGEWASAKLRNAVDDDHDSGGEVVGQLRQVASVRHPEPPSGHVIEARPLEALAQSHRVALLDGDVQNLDAT